jgi:hypothetical protein
MYYEIEFEFQIAARKRAAGDQTPSACSLAANHPPQGSIFLAAFASGTRSKLGHGSPFTIHKPRVTSHGILIETPRLKITATALETNKIENSNRDKIWVLRPPYRLDAFLGILIANLELEFRVTRTKLNPLRISNRKFSPLLRLQFSSPPRSISANESRVTHHSSLSVLIHGSAIKSQRNPCKDNNLKISNRRQTGGLRHREPKVNSRLKSDRIAFRRRIARTSRREVA